MSAPTLQLVQPKPEDPTVEWARAARRRVESALEDAFQIALEDLGWRESIELLSAYCEGLADESGSWARDVWRARAKALSEMAADQGLR